MIRDGRESGRRGVGEGGRGGGGSRFGRGAFGSGVGGVYGGFVTGRHAPVPAAVALLLLDAGVVPGLVAGIAEVGQHVRPQALVL